MRIKESVKRILACAIVLVLAAAMIPAVSMPVSATEKKIGFESENLSIRKINANGVLIDTEGNAWGWGQNVAGAVYGRTKVYDIACTDDSPVKAYIWNEYAQELKKLRCFDTDVTDVRMLQGNTSFWALATLKNDGTANLWTFSAPGSITADDNSTIEYMKEPWVQQSPTKFDGYGRITYIYVDGRAFYFINSDGNLYRAEYNAKKVEEPKIIGNNIKKYACYNYPDSEYILYSDGKLMHNDELLLSGVKDFTLGSGLLARYNVFALTNSSDIYHVELTISGDPKKKGEKKICGDVSAIYSESYGFPRCYALKHDCTLYIVDDSSYKKVNLNEQFSSASGNYLMTQKGEVYYCGSGAKNEVPFDTSSYETNYRNFKIANWTKIKGAAPVRLLETKDLAQDLVLNATYLDDVKDASTAGTAVKDATSSMTSEQKKSPLGVDKATIYAEEAVARAATTELTGDDIVIDQALVSDLNTKSSEAVNTVENSLSNVGINLDREINEAVIVNTAGEGKRTVKFAGDIDANDVDSIIVQQGDLRVVVPTDVIAEEGGFAVTIGEDSSTGTIVTCDENSASVTLEPFAASMGQSFKVTFDKSKLKSNVKISIPATGGDTKYQAIVDKNGKAIGGKYNPITGKLEAKISEGGTFTVKTNEIDFSDITGKSAAMKAAIKELAAKGIIGGTSATTFSPDKSISRAELAAIILRTLGKVDASADGKFTDVPKSKWYFATAGSSKKYGLVTGYPDGTFKGDVAISKVQTIAVSARTLRSEMNYKTPASVATYIGKYTDGSSIASWAAGDVALATRENLVVRRSDGKFAPDENITRGEAALILKTLFDRVW